MTLTRGLREELVPLVRMAGREQLLDTLAQIQGRVDAHDHIPKVPELRGCTDGGDESQRIRALWKGEVVVAGALQRARHDHRAHAVLHSVGDNRDRPSQWHASGLRPLSSKEAPDGGAEAPLVLPAAMECNLLRPDGLNAEEGYLACRNFDVLKRYNASTLYAISVAELADGLESSDVLERVPL